MNKKIVSLITSLMIPMMFLVGCKKSQEEFYMTEDTTAIDGSVEYSAKTYKEAFYSTNNYSDEYLQQELNSIIDEITSQEDKEELIEVFKAYTSTNDADLTTIKSYYEKYNVMKQNSKNSDLDSNPMYEISSRFYKATLNSTKKYYDINDFYIYYKNELSDSNLKNEDLDNKIKITAIKEYTLANIYKSAYNDSFITKLITELENNNSTDEIVIEESSNKNDNQSITPSQETNSTNNTTTDRDSDSDSDSDNDTYPNYLELTEVVKSQIYDAGVSAAIDFIGENLDSTPSEYARSVYDALENDNPLGDNKEEGYLSFLSGFKTTITNNSIEFN